MSEKTHTMCTFDLNWTCPFDGFPPSVPNGHGGNRMIACVACSTTRVALALERSALCLENLEDHARGFGRSLVLLREKMDPSPSP